MSNLNFLKYLREDSTDELPLDEIHVIKKTADDSILTKKINEIENENIPVFIDSETGRVYKTERALKAAITRRRNKQKKERKHD